MATMTVTQTRVQAPAPAAAVLLRLRVRRQAPSEEIRQILVKMQRLLPKLPQEVRVQIQRWEESFFGEYHVDSPVEEERIRAAHALLILCASHIQHNIVDHAALPQNENMKWAALSVKIKEVVLSLLPEHINGKAFIEAAQKKQQEIIRRLKMVPVIQAIMIKVEEDCNRVFTQMEERVYERAHQINQGIQHDFAETRRQLIALNDGRALSMESCHAICDQLTSRVTAIYQGFEQQLKEMDDLGQRAEMKSIALRSILNECEDVINRIRV